MKELNGRSQNESNTPGNTPIEKLLGRNIYNSKYFTDDIEVYEKRLGSMNLHELYQHSIETIGEAKRMERPKLISKLKNQFKQYHKMQQDIYDKGVNYKQESTPQKVSKSAQSILDLTN